MPSPPYFFGEQTSYQLTAQLPHVDSSTLPFHRKLLLSLSILLVSHLLGANKVKR